MGGPNRSAFYLFGFRLAFMAVYRDWSVGSLPATVVGGMPIYLLRDDLGPQLSTVVAGRTFLVRNPWKQLRLGSCLKL